MAIVSEVILKLGVDSTGVFENLDKVKSKYGATTDEVRKQQAELAKLIKFEQGLLAERAKTTSPNTIVQYNAEIKKTQAEIAKLNQSLSQTAKATSNVDKEAKTLSNDMKKAFDGTAIQGAEKKAVSLKAQLRELKTQLASTDDDQEFERLSIEAGKLEDRIGDASTAARIFASDSKFEILGNALGNVGQKLLALDFDGAVQGSKLLVKASSQITFKDAIGGVKQIGQTLFNVGKALLTNPLFLIGAAVALIITSIDDLKASFDAGTESLKANAEALEAVIEATEALARANRDLALENDLAANKITKSDADRAKNQNKFKDQYLDILQEQRSATKKFNEDIQKERDDDTFHATKSIFEFFGGETELTARQKVGLRSIEETFGKQVEELKKGFGLENDKLLINQANEERKIRTEAAKKNFEDAERELQALANLRRKTEEQRNQGAISRIDKTTIAGVEEEAEILKTIAEQQTSFQRQELDKQFKNKKNLESAKVQLALQLALTEEAIEKEKVDKIKKINDDNLKQAIDRNKSLVEIEIENAEISTNQQVDSYSAKIGVAVAYYDGLIQLAQSNGESTIELEAQKNNALLKLDKEHQEETFALKNDVLSEEQRHQLALLGIANTGKLEMLAVEIAFEKARLTLLEESGTATEAEIQKQKNKIIELEASANSELEKLDEERKKQALDNIKVILDATLKAINQILAAEIQRVDKQISLQQKRVDEAARIAENGNAQLLELEKKRLDDLTKEKEKFVRAQQALAVVELIANTAIAISKAAAEGGAAAGITIAAALIALIAGLASARSIAGQAAFYEGGYTGDGNPRSESTAVGKRPYIYHKAEFVHDHKTTKKYRSIFEDVHKGKVDLNEMKSKSELYDMLKMNNIDTSKDVYLRSAESANSSEIGRLKTSIESVVEAIKSQPGMQVRIDENGIFMITNKYYKNQQRIDSIT